MKNVAMATLGMWELLVILLIVLVIFGAGKLPQLGEGLGKAIRNFKRSYRESPREIEGQARSLDEAEPPAELPARNAAAGAKPPREKE